MYIYGRIRVYNYLIERFSFSTMKIRYDSKILKSIISIMPEIICLYRKKAKNVCHFHGLRSLLFCCIVHGKKFGKNAALPLVLLRHYTGGQLQRSS